MSLIAKNSGGGDFELAPEGSFIARCYRIIDLGTQDTEYNGERRRQQKVILTFELLDPNALMKDGRPFSVSKRYTNSLNEKSQLRKDLQAWRGKRFTDEELEGFDLTKVIGAYCHVQIVHTEGANPYANIDAIMSTRERPEPFNDTAVFDLSDPDMKLFESLSDKLKETIQLSEEWQQRTALQRPAPATRATGPGSIGDDIAGAAPVDLSEIPF